MRASLNQTWQEQESTRQYGIASAEQKDRGDDMIGLPRKGSSSGKNVGGKIKAFKKKVADVRPWRITQDLPRACLDVVIAGVGYLL